MTAYPATVTVWTDSAEHASQVLNERLGPDEDYGFEYSVGFTFDYPVTPGTSGPPAPPARWTVIGIWIDDEPIPVGTVKGVQDVYGGETSHEFQGPWALDVEAESAEAAEPLAVEKMRGTL